MGKRKYLTSEQTGKMGGEEKLRRHGKQAFSEMGIKGGNKLKEERGSDYYKKIRQIGIEKAKKRKQSPIQKFTNILTGNK